MPWQPRVIIGLFLLIGASASLAIPDEPKPAKRPLHKSPLGLVVDEKGEKAYVALHAAGAVAEVDLKAGKVLREIPVGGGCYDLDRLGNTLYVSCEAEGFLGEFDLEKGALIRKWQIGPEPRGVSANRVNQLILVVVNDGRKLATLDIRTKQVKFSELKDAFTKNANRNDTSNLPNATELSGVADLSSAERFSQWSPHLIRYGKRTENIGKGEGFNKLWMSSRSDGVTNNTGWAYQGGAIYAAHQKPRNDVPASQVAQGWLFTNAVSGFFPSTDFSYLRFLAVLDEPNRAYADPIDVHGVNRGPQNVNEKADNQDPLLFVASAGADVIHVVDWKRVKSHHWANLERSVYNPEDLTASRNYVIARIPTRSNPRRMEISGDGKTLVVSNYLADSLTVIDTEKLQVIRHIPLGGPEPDAVRRGEILFNSGKMTFQGQFTCASCHPNGDQDGLNWDLERDGIGNFKNTKSLLGIKDTAPYGWHGSSATLADRVRGTLRSLHRHEPTGTEVEDLVAYLESLPPPRPLPVKDEDKPAVARGRTLFQDKAACATCHPGPTYQDGKSHDIGTARPTDTQSRFDTPSLRGVARTAPYLHDGKAPTLADVFTKGNPKQQHGAAHTLSKEELADLIAYLRSL